MSKLRSPLFDCSMTIGTELRDDVLMINHRKRILFCCETYIGAMQPRFKRGRSRGPERQIREPPKLSPTARNRIENKPGKETQHSDDDDSGNQDCGRKTRHQARVRVSDHQRNSENQPKSDKQRSDQSIVKRWPLHPVERDDRPQDPPAIGEGRELRLGSFRARGINGFTSPTGILSSSAWTLISVSISNPEEITGKLFTNRRENTRYPEKMSLKLRPNNPESRPLKILFPSTWPPR